SVALVLVGYFLAYNSLMLFATDSSSVEQFISFNKQMDSRDQNSSQMQHDHVSLDQANSCCTTNERVGISTIKKLFSSSNMIVWHIPLFNLK
ncbi:MAG: hypothetical protein MHMPM18_002718, partial [Marteilia pararefringens]